MLFVRSGQFFNPARIYSDQLLSAEGSSVVKFSSTNMVAIALTTIVVQHSNIRTPIVPGNSTSPVFRIVGIPFSQEWRRTVALWGMKLKFDDITGPIYRSGMAFQTRAPGKQFSSGSSFNLFKSFFY